MEHMVAYLDKQSNIIGLQNIFSNNKLLFNEDYYTICMYHQHK